MKSILKNALMGILLIAGTTKPAVTEEQVKTALISIIPTNGTITNETIKECVGNLNWGNPWWLCSEINTALKADKTPTINATSYNSVNGYLPYMKTIYADTTTNTVKKLVVITENNVTICGIIFTKTATNCTAEYKTKNEVVTIQDQKSLQSMFGLANRGLASFYCVPTEYRGPLYTAGKYLAKAAVFSAILYGGKKFLNWYADKTPLLNEIADLKNQMANLSQRMSGHAASIASTAIVAPAATTAAAAATTVLTEVVVPASKGFIENAIAVGKEIIKRH